MKRLFLLFAIAFVAISAMASLKDMSWTIYGMECGSTYCYDVKVQKDTIVNGQTYYYIPATHSLSADKMAFGAFLREDGQKVYLLNDKTGEDMLLYDYSLQNGDSIRIIFASNSSPKKWSYSPQEDFDMPTGKLYCYVTDVNMVTLENGEQRKCLRLDAGSAMFDIIEGIGSTRGILAAVNYWPQTTCDHNSKLLCCSENKQLLYKEDPSLYENMPGADKIICGCEKDTHSSVTHANTWTIYSYFVDAMNPEENSGYFTTVTAGQDTIIDGKTYFQAAGFLFRYNEDSTRIYCRVTEDDLQNNESFDIGKYFTSKCIKDNEILCYAYDVQANDTLNILRYGTDAWATIYVIDSVKTMDGRRYVYNHYLDGDLPHSDEESEIMTSEYYQHCRWETECWIEGMGSSRGFFQDHPERVASMYFHSGSYVVCASHDDELIYRESEEKAKSIYKEYGIISPCHEDVIDAVENVAVEESATKIFRDGQVLILRGGIIYNTLGQEIK